MKIPLLKSKRLELVAPSPEAFPVYLKFYSSSDASKHYGGPLSSEQIWARLKADIGSWHMLGLGVWVVKELYTNSLIGTCGFWKGYDWPIELTWWILPEARGKEYATEASKAAIEYAYQSLKWESVQTYMNDENTAARNLAIKLGGAKSDRKKFPDGLERDIYQIPRNP